jgi:ribosomal 30S subunit maturation factor RimM
MNVLPPPLTLVGKIHGKHGYDGRLSIECFATSKKIISKGNYLFVVIDGKGVPFCITDVNKTQELIKLRGIDTEEKAKALIGLAFGVPASKKMSVIPSINGLVGFGVFDQTSGFKGVITQVDELPQGPMLTAIGSEMSVDTTPKPNSSTQEEQPSQEVLIPLVESWISRIEESEPCIFMELPEGLIHLND